MCELSSWGSVVEVKGDVKRSQEVTGRLPGFPSSLGQVQALAPRGSSFCFQLALFTCNLHPYSSPPLHAPNTHLIPSISTSTASASALSSPRRLLGAHLTRSAPLQNSCHLRLIHQ